MKKETKTERFQLRCTKQQRDLLDVESKKRGKHKSDLIWEAFEEYLKNNK